MTMKTAMIRLMVRVSISTINKYLKGSLSRPLKDFSILRPLDLFELGPGLAWMQRIFLQCFFVKFKTQAWSFRQ